MSSSFLASNIMKKWVGWHQDPKRSQSCRLLCKKASTEIHRSPQCQESLCDTLRDEKKGEGNQKRGKWSTRSRSRSVPYNCLCYSILSKNATKKSSFSMETHIYSKGNKRQTQRSTSFSDTVIIVSEISRTNSNTCIVWGVRDRLRSRSDATNRTSKQRDWSSERLNSTLKNRAKKDVLISITTE